MSEHIFKLPDLGEGMVEAEIVAWHVKPGDMVRDGDVVVDVMTDKANIEVPAPATGKVLRTSGQPGDMVAVGSELMAIEVASGKTVPADLAPRVVEPSAAVEEAPPGTGAPETSAAEASPAPAPEPIKEPEPAPATAAQAAPKAEAAVKASSAADSLPASGERVRTSPAVRRRAKETGVDLGTVQGSGPRGRILMRDLEAHVSGAPVAAPATPAAAGTGEVNEIKVIGVRRLIANRLQAAKQQIPHFAYVEEVDITALESLRQRLNATREGADLTYLPFIGLALIRALKDFPQCNAHFDPERGVLKQFERVHLGVATQTPDGLKVPVVHNAGSRSLWDLAAEIRRVTTAARDNKASREEMTGSTITITSLGRLGGIVSTPIINAPETSIIGINKAVETPVVIDGRITVRRMMNLSSSFDHRFVDGHDGASLIQAIRGYLEEPATIFIEG